MTFQQIVWVWCLGTTVSAIYDNVFSPVSTLDRTRSYAENDPRVAEVLNSIPFWLILLYITLNHFLLWWLLPLRLFNEYQQHKGK